MGLVTDTMGISTSENKLNERQTSVFRYNINETAIEGN